MHSPHGWGNLWGPLAAEAGGQQGRESLVLGWAPSGLLQPSWVDVPVAHEVFPTFTSLVFPAALDAFHFISLSLCHCFTDLFLPKTRAPRNAAKHLLSTTLKPKQEAQSRSFHFLPKWKRFRKPLGQNRPSLRPALQAACLLPCMTECFVSGDCDASRFNDEALPHFIFPPL